MVEVGTEALILEHYTRVPDIQRKIAELSVSAILQKFPAADNFYDEWKYCKRCGDPDHEETVIDRPHFHYICTADDGGI